MGLEPIRVELSDYLKVELLREEEERLAGELGEVEKNIRECLIAGLERDFLKSLSPYYSRLAQEGGEDAHKVAELESRRALVHGTLEVVRGQRQQFEETLGVPAAGRAGHAPARRAAQAVPGGKRSRFDSFEQFRQTQDPVADPGQPQS
jgi:hypothetical protein